MRAHAGGIIAGGLTLLTTAAALPFLGPRPQVASLLLLVATWYAIDRRRLWLLPVTFLAWANLHAGYAPGLLAVGLFAVTQRDRRVWLASALSVAALFVNPNTWHFVAFSLAIVGPPEIRQIGEWQAWDLRDARLWPYPAIAGIYLLCVMFRRPRLTLFEASTALAFMAASLTAVRLVPYSAIALAILAARVVPREVRSPEARSPRVLQAGLAALLLGMLVLAVRAPGRHDPATDARLPVRAVAEADLSGRLLNAYNWGGYLIWHQVPVFIDGRCYDLYTQGTQLRDYFAVHNVRPDADRVLQDYAVDTVLFDRDAPLVRYLQAKGWRTTFEDGPAVVLKRDR
jgi:hypothetical protein